MNIEFFSPTSPFAALDEEWELQSNNATEAKQTNVALNKHGDHLRSVQRDHKENITLSFISKKTTGNFSFVLESAVALAVGVVAQGYHIDTLGITYNQNNPPQLDITAHKHLAGKGHWAKPDGDGGCRVYEPSLTFPALEIGCPTSLGDAFTLTEECSNTIRSITYQLQVNHIDEADRVGEHLAGDNYDGTETLSIEFTGALSSGDFTIKDGSGWLIDNNAHPRSNTGATTTSLNLTHHVAHKTGAGGDVRVTTSKASGRMAPAAE